jgi:hypothetical protein
MFTAWKIYFIQIEHLSDYVSLIMFIPIMNYSIWKSIDGCANPYLYEDDFRLAWYGLSDENETNVLSHECFEFEIDSWIIFNILCHELVITFPFKFH